MSGGVDSSVAAALLQQDGYEVVGCFMRLGSPGETLDELIPDADTCDPAKVRIGHQGCCSINDAADARQVAAQLDIPFYVCNFKQDFGRIIDYFVDEYAAGRTPNPCVRCNDWLKFGKLHDYARQIGADFVASGHYARIDTTNGSPRLLQGVDQSKDQSYVLFGVPRDHLSRMLLPVGDYEQTQIRQLAQDLGLPVFDKPDSQEICFVPDNDYASLVERKRPETARQGEILDRQGNVIGQHEGHHRFTIGQRRGVGVALGYPIYIVDKDPIKNTVTVGTQEDLLVQGCTAAEANWLTDETQFRDFSPCFAQYRYNSRPVRARVRTLSPLKAPTPSGRSGAFEVRFDEPQAAIAAGQAVVLYDINQPEAVLGGGWIIQTQPITQA